MHTEYWWEIQRERNLGLRYEDNVKMDLSGTGWVGMDWTNVA
jgi:hypothetical protein